MSLNMGYAASQVLLNALVTWGLARIENAPESLEHKKVLFVFLVSPSNC